MTAPIDLMQLRRRRFSEPQFMLCANCVDDTRYQAIVIEGKDGPVVTGLLCLGPKCPEDGTLTPLVNGSVSS